MSTDRSRLSGQSPLTPYPCNTGCFVCDWHRAMWNATGLENDPGARFTQHLRAALRVIAEVDASKEKRP